MILIYVLIVIRDVNLDVLDRYIEHLVTYGILNVFGKHFYVMFTLSPCCQWFLLCLSISIYLFVRMKPGFITLYTKLEFIA
jgi:hypothetical protein